MPDESVRVAVRVRPFNGREKERKAKCVIDMQGKMTTIKDPDAPDQPPKEFSFDFSYWSHDGYHEDDKGVLVADNEKYATQRKVFNDLGQGVLDNALEGFNCSLFAYGQTGAGKSFSMVGYGPNKGIVPISCDELFKVIEGNAGGTTKYQVTFSMLEIYNEQVRDLLTKDNPKGGLPVRQNPKIGAFYVQGLKYVAVGSYKEIERRTEEGTANRTVASTQMNATSSRAHTVVTIQFDQIIKNDMGQETKKSSIINLVDLAGSERADSTGATGDRLKEGANINKSLSALGNVISALADLSLGKKKVLVPYRDSVLTKLLQNALGGNSKTIMIAALSPADINYDETLSTLRYADRAKKIKNKAVINENPMDKLIRELKEENERLKKAMEGGGLPSVSESAGMTEAEREKMRKQMEEEIRAQFEANAEAMSREMSWETKLAQSRQEEVNHDADAQKVKTVPHLVNLNEDDMLSKIIKHFLSEGDTTIGRKDGSPDIVMTGLSILKQHVIISYKNGEVTMKPGTQGAKTKVNGMPLTGERVIKHKDRILFGSNHMFFLVNPINEEKSEGTPDVVDWEFAQKEIAQAKGFQTGFGAGLSKDQQIAQEQVLELLPLVSEVNAISEEVDKHKSFEVILISGAAQEGTGKETKVMVKMKSLLNDNVWLWDRGKFMNRRYLMQDHYQRFLDGDETVKSIAQEEDPFWEPPEPVLIGTSNVFLQSLSYALDFDDKLGITDYKGAEEGNLIIFITPCTATGKPHDEDYFVEDPKDLIGKPFHYKVVIRNADVYKTRYSTGIFVKYKIPGETEHTETIMVENTLSPEFNHSKVFTIPAVTQETLDWFEQGSINFSVYAKQIDSISDKRLLKMTTKELRQMEHLQKPSLASRQSSIRGNNVSEMAQLKSELILTKRKLDRADKKEKRLQDLVTDWGKKPAEEQTFESFHRAMHAAVFYERGKLKYKMNMLRSYLKNQKDASANGGTIKTEIKPDQQGSKACSVM